MANLRWERDDPQRGLEPPPFLSDPESPARRRPRLEASRARPESGEPSALLVVEDSRADRIALEHALSRGFPAHPIELAETIASARRLLDANTVSVAIVDCVLADGCGLELLDAYPAVPTIVVTGSGSERVAAEALRKGAVDYVIKEEGCRHFDQVRRATELALARRRPSAAPARSNGSSVVRFGNFELDLVRDELLESGAPCEVHRTPMRLLTYLVRHADRTVPKEELLEQVWEGTLVSDTAIASALKEVRHVLRDDGTRQRVIQTRRGSGYRFVAPLGSPDRRPARTGSEGRRPSLAVVPLENVSKDGDWDCVALGMTDALIGELARIDALRVIPRTSVMRLRDRAFSSVHDVGREFGVDLLVAGSIACDGPRVRVCAELLDVATERLLWTEQYDREGEDLLDLESEIARALAREVRLALVPQERRPLNDPVSIDPAAQDAFLLGKVQYRLYSSERVTAALRHFQHAVAYSPCHAPAHVAMAECYLTLCSEFGSISAEEAVSHARRATDRALALDCSLGAAHAVRGAYLAYFDWRWTEAEAAFQRAFDLCPGDPVCMMGHARIAATMGRAEEGLDLARRALACDPLNLPLRLQLARLLWCARRWDEALCEQLRVAAMEPSLALVEWEIGASLHHLGRYPAAVEHWRKAMVLSDLPADAGEAMCSAFARGGIDAWWRTWLALSAQGVREAAVPASWTWLPHAAIGEVERAMDELERVVERRTVELALLGVSPSFDALRCHARFQRLIHRVRLPAKEDGECESPPSGPGRARPRRDEARVEPARIVQPERW